MCTNTHASDLWLIWFKEDTKRVWKCVKETLPECGKKNRKALVKEVAFKLKEMTFRRSERVQLQLLNVCNKMTASSSYPPQYSCHSEIFVLTSNNNMEHLPTDTCKIQPKVNCFWSLLKRLAIEYLRFLLFTLQSITILWILLLESMYLPPHLCITSHSLVSSLTRSFAITSLPIVLSNKLSPLLPECSL